MSSSRFRGTQRELREIGRERRGRPRSGNVKVSCKLHQTTHQELESISKLLPQLRATQSEMVGLGVDLLGRRIDIMAAAISRNDTVLPAGVVDLEALYLVWDLKPPEQEAAKTTTVYLLPEQTVRLSEVRSRLRLQIRVNRDDLLNLGARLLAKSVQLALRGGNVPMVRQVGDLQSLISDFV